MNTLLNTIYQYGLAQPGSTALISGQLDDAALTQTVSYQSLSRQIDGVADTFKTLQCQKIGLYLDNSIDWIVCDLAAMSAEITLIPIPLFFSPSQIRHLIDDSNIDALIVANPEHLQELTQAEIATGQIHKLPQLSACLTKPETAETTSRKNSLPNGTAKLTYTSGSTGMPKGVCLSSDSILNIAGQLAQAVNSLELNRHLCLLPLSTLLENIAGVYVPLLKGSTIQVEPLEQLGITLSSTVNHQQLLFALQQLQPNSIIALPQLLRLFVHCKQGLQNKNGETSPFSQLRFIALGGGKTSPQLLEQAQELGLPVYEGYGLSECASVVSLNTPENHRIGSVGKPLQDNSVSIAPDGEIHVSGPVMLGYGNQSEAIPMPYPTGDLGYLDDDGFLYISGRKKNLIISSFGRNISPEWVESTLECQPEIKQCVVIGEGQSSLSAVIVPTVTPFKADTDNTSLHSEVQTAIARCNTSLPDYARIHHWVFADEAFSQNNGLLTYNGRPRREAIAEQYSFLLNGKHTMHTENIKIKHTPGNQSAPETVAPGFFERLEAETQVERDYLLAAPIISDALAGNVDTDAYIAFLTQAYHHVKHTVPLLMACGGKLDSQHEWLRKAIAEYIDEELGHEEWILDDIAESGGDSHTVRHSAPHFSTDNMVSYAYDTIQRKNPVGFFGMVFVLEGTSISIAPQVAACLKEQLDIPPRAFTYLDTHGSLDLEHMDFFKKLMNRLNDEQDQQAVIDTAKAMFQLYGNIFRSLPRTAQAVH